MLILRITLGKAIAFFCLPEVFCGPKYAKMRFWPRLRPRQSWGSLRRSLRGRDSLPYTSAHSAPSALRSSRLRRSPLVSPPKPGAPAALGQATGLKDTQIDQKQTHTHKRKACRYSTL